MRVYTATDEPPGQLSDTEQLPQNAVCAVAPKYLLLRVRLIPTTMSDAAQDSRTGIGAPDGRIDAGHRRIEHECRRAVDIRDDIGAHDERSEAAKRRRADRRRRGPLNGRSDARLPADAEQPELAFAQRQRWATARAA